MYKRKVFISSTIFDLQEERQYIKNYFNALHIGELEFEVIMSEYPETFYLQENDFVTNHSYDVCLDKIGLCDYYILLINKRYNVQRIEGNDISITHMEFREALKCRIPILVFINEKTEDARQLFQKNFRQAYIAQNQIKIFEFIDEINKRKAGNWRMLYKDKNDLITTLDAIFCKFDNSIFIGEYPPDGQVFNRGEKILHTWVIQNKGNVIWQNRILEPINAEVFGLDKKELTINLGIVYPEERKEVTIEFNAPNVEGVYEIIWKMKNEYGELSFMNKIGLGLHFKVVKSRKYV